MKKIYSDSEIWNKEWYLKYSLKLRMLLKYIFDNAHTSGVFEPNYIMLSFYMQETVTKDDILDLQRIYQEYECKKNPDASLIEELPDGKFWVVGMAYFQCGVLSQNTPAHKKTIEILLNYGLLERVVSQYKEQDKKKVGLLQGLLKKTATPETPIAQDVEVIEGEAENDVSKGSPNLGLGYGYPSATLGLPMAYPSANLALPIAYPSATLRDRDKDRDKDKDRDRDRDYLSHDSKEKDCEEREREKQAKEREKEPSQSVLGASCFENAIEPGREIVPVSKPDNVVPISSARHKLSPESPEVVAFCADYGDVKEGRRVKLSAKERQDIARVLELEGGIYDAEYWRSVFWNAKGGWQFDKGRGNVERSKCSLKTILEKHGEIYRKELPLKYLPRPKPATVCTTVTQQPDGHAHEHAQGAFAPIPEHVVKKVSEISKRIRSGG